MSKFYYFLVNIPYLCCLLPSNPLNSMSNIMAMFLFEVFWRLLCFSSWELRFWSIRSKYFLAKICVFWLGERQRWLKYDSDMPGLWGLPGRPLAPAQQLIMRHPTFFVCCADSGFLNERYLFNNNAFEICIKY